MPKIPIDYSKALIYSIVCKTDETLIYVGSTTNFTKRKTHHKTACYCENNRCHNLQVYVMIRANGGWDNFDMKPVKEYACENNIQLIIEEERVRKELQATLNTRRAFLSEEEAKELRRKYNQQYREEHITKIKEIQRNYSQNYEQEHKAEKNKYRQEHKTEIKEYQKEYREAHVTKYKKYQKEYREAHAAELKEKARLRKDEKSKKARERYLAKKLSSATIL